MNAVKRVVFFLIIIFLLSTLTKTIADYMKNMSFYNGYKAEYEKEKKRNIALKTQIIKNNDPYQLEKTIRNNLNLTRSNEVAIVLPTPTAIPTTPTPTPEPVWHQWSDVFFSHN